ncbi:MAG: addiction module protein [Gemmataceae bacterium]|nr:addiction module protein [Gemmataceae bacterium]
MSVDAILKEVEALPADERSELLGRLFDRYADSGPDLAAEMPAALRAELERRIADSDANPGSGIPWEVVRAEARKRFRS